MALVLVIEDDEWVADLLSTSIREAGYELALAATAERGLELAIARTPDCIVCDVDLPDNDGYWVARNVRTHPSRVSVTPFLFLSAYDDEEARLKGFHVGADVYITKPFRVDELIAQVEALVHMAERLRVRRDSMLSSAPAAPTTIEGDISQMSIATVLTILELERRSGMMEVISKKRRAVLEIASGAVVQGMVGGTQVSALVALRTMLGWNVGRFFFNATTPREPTPREPPGSRKRIGALLMEALRLQDEAARSELELPPSRAPAFEHKLAGPSLGGPPSTPANFAPPSTHRPEFVRSAPPSSGAEELADWEIASVPPSFPLSSHGAPPPGKKS